MSKASRRKGRREALQRLYAFDQKHFQDDGKLVPLGDMSSEEEIVALAALLFDGVCEEREAIDRVVAEKLNNWTIDRMAVCDRSILRLGAFELMYRQDVPTRVIINEYVDLAKEYGSNDRTPKLVNGVLDSISKEKRSAPAE